MLTTREREPLCRALTPAAVHVMRLQDIHVAPPVKWEHEEANLVSSLGGTCA